MTTYDICSIDTPTTVPASASLRDSLWTLQPTHDATEDSRRYKVIEDSAGEVLGFVNLQTSDNAVNVDDAHEVLSAFIRYRRGIRPRRILRGKLAIKGARP